MNKKFIRFICGFLTVLTLVAMVPAFTITAFAEDGAADSTQSSASIDYTAVSYDNAQDRLASMVKYFENDEYALYVDQVIGNDTVTTLGVVAYEKKATGEVLFTNPYSLDANEESPTYTPLTGRKQMMSQILFNYSGNGASGVELTSYEHAALKGQIAVKRIKNGVRVEYAIGERSARILVPMVIERTSFEEKIMTPIKENASSRDYMKFMGYFTEWFYTDPTMSQKKKEDIAALYPATQEKDIDIYVCSDKATTKELRWLESVIMAYCPSYNFEQLDNDHDFVGHVETAMSPAVFRMALEYTLSDNGLLVSLSGNGLKFDETVYRISDFQILPYMGASQRTNDGYSFVPDGSGSLYDLSTSITGGRSTLVYGDDFALSNKSLYTYQTEVARMPVFGQVETVYYDAEGKRISKADYNPDLHTSVDRGYFAVIEQGETLAKITANHESHLEYASVIPSFTVRQRDKSETAGWDVFAKTRYVDSYQIRYMILSDDGLAEKAALNKYYECSWMGMACAYRDYLASKGEGFDRLTAEDVEANIPLYIETFGAVDTIKKVMSMPVTVSVGLTTFENIGEMYDYLAGNGVTNVNFKMKGYANGGLYSDVPYKLKWESSVGGSSGFKDLVEKAAEDGFGIYPDFDFVYSTQSDAGSKVSMKKHAARTIDNRYTSKRVYSATYQSLVSHFQMVMSPVTYSRFYEKLEKRYSKYDVASIALSSFGNSVNSDYDEDKTSLREDSKEYVIQALSYFKNEDYSVMLEGGNAFTWHYADHILNVPMDSSRYTDELTSIPFMGVVLHGYKEFAGSAFNMEGNLSYAMLKAMENGAAAYFVLSYANTELLKEDEVLSQNYSVRYDIWQQRLVEIYLELNSVLADVQTKLIVDHQNLNDVSSRLPDADELLKDIEEDAKNKAQAIADKIEAERLAKLEALRNASDVVAAAAVNVTNSVSKVTADIGSEALSTDTSSMLAQLRLGTERSELLKAWQAWRTAMAGDNANAKVSTLAALKTEVQGLIIDPAMRVANEIANARNELLKAKFKYNYLNEDYKQAPAHQKAAKLQVLTAAEQDLRAAIAAYCDLYNACMSTSFVVDADKVNAFIAADDTQLVDQLITMAPSAAPEIIVAAADLNNFIFAYSTSDVSAYAEIGVMGLYKAFSDLLAADGYFVAIESTENALPELEPTVEEYDPSAEQNNIGAGSATTTEQEAATSKYAVDNNVVCVTFGDSKDDPYKSLLLNFNDYTIETVYNGVRYTIEAYGYVVIMH